SQPYKDQTEMGRSGVKTAARSSNPYLGAARTRVKPKAQKKSQPSGTLLEARTG
ncbi:hypothetical protein HispidOSU_005088, partial [Sigmodon hispidus]